MALKYSFVDDEAYGTEDINNITADLVGAGIAPFPNKSTYSVSDLNTLTEVLVGEGTTLGGCKCTYSENTGKISVAEGIVFFENGTKLTIDEDGVELEPQANSEGYVYAVYNTSVQTAEIKYAAELPAAGDFVALCRVSSTGTVYDLRTYARSKVLSLGKNAVQDADIEWFDTTYINDEGRLVFGTVKADVTKFNYALVWYAPEKDKKHFGLFDLEIGRFIYSTNGLTNPQIQFYTGSYYDVYNMELTDGKLYITAPAHAYNVPTAVTVKLI